LTDRLVSGESGEEDKSEITLRPQSFAEFVGAEKTKSNLQIYIEAARKRGGVLDHILFSGPPGTGKTTLSHIVAKCGDANFIGTSGPAIEKAKDLAGVLTRLERGDVLFIDEIHRLNIVVEEHLYSAMEDYVIDIVVDSGPHARTIKIDLKPFTLIGATTREGLISAPMRSRFGVLEKLGYYSSEELGRILNRSAKILDVDIDDEGVEVIASRARGTPRVVNRLLRRVRDLADVRADGHISREIADSGLEMLGVDELGLDEMDRRILAVLITADGTPVGIKTIATSVGETEDTLEEVYEPFLIQQGLIYKTPRGRLVTPKAFEHMKASDQAKGGGLFP